MSDGDILKLEITSDPAELPVVRDQVRSWTQAQTWTEQEAADIVLAVDEALSNVIRHGYEGKPGHQIHLAFRSVRDSAHGAGLEICIRDFGKQVPLDSIAGRDLDDLRPGGLGVHIIRSVMAEVEYSHAPGGGMQLVMRKYRERSSNDPGSQAGQP